MDPGPGTSLQCSDFAFCSTYDVNTYIAPNTTPTGGTVVDGIYRLAWVIDPPESGRQAGTEYGEAFRVRGNQFVYGENGGRGTLTFSDIHVTFRETGRCELGKDYGETDTEVEYEYTATRDQLTLYAEIQVGGGRQWIREYVYVRVEDACLTVANPPSTPGDSYRCEVANCVCRQAVGGTVEACT